MALMIGLYDSLYIGKQTPRKLSLEKSPPTPTSNRARASHTPDNSPDTASSEIFLAGQSILKTPPSTKKHQVFGVFLISHLH
jgi:hypothetical protein